MKLIKDMTKVELEKYYNMLHAQIARHSPSDVKITVIINILDDGTIKCYASDLLDNLPDVLRDLAERADTLITESAACRETK